MLIDPCINMFYNKEIAKRFGARAAVVLNRIIWSINIHASSPERWAKDYLEDGVWWMEDSIEAFVRFFEGTICEKSIRNDLKAMEDAGLLLGKKRRANEWNHTKSYAVDIAVYKEMISGGDLDVEKNSTSEAESDHRPMRKKNPAHDGNVSRMTTKISPNESSESQTKNRQHLPEDLAIASAWQKYAEGELPWQKGKAGFSVETFATAIRKVRSAAGLSHEGIQKVFDFVYADKFWRDHAISPAGLLKKNDSGIRKIDSILLQMTKAERKHNRVAAMVNSDEDPF